MSTPPTTPGSAPRPRLAAAAATPAADETETPATPATAGHAHPVAAAVAETPQQPPSSKKRRLGDAALGALVLLLVWGISEMIGGRKTPVVEKASSGEVKAASNELPAASAPAEAAPAAQPAAPQPEKVALPGGGFSLKLVRFQKADSPIGHKGAAIRASIEGSEIQTKVADVSDLGPQSQQDLKSGHIVYFRNANPKMPPGTPEGARYFFRREWKSNPTALRGTILPVSTKGLLEAGYTAVAVQVPRVEGDYVDDPSVQFLDSVAYHKAGPQPTDDELMRLTAMGQRNVGQ
jgi:hypothetical protein